MMTKRNSWQIFKDVIFALLLRELQTRLGARRMGIFWTLFEPATHVGIMTILVTVIRRHYISGFDYAVFLVYGLIPFFMMRNITHKIMNSVDGNRALFAYPNIKIIDTFAARAILEILIYSIILVIFIFILGFWVDDDVSIVDPLMAVIYFLLGIIFSFGLGVLLSYLMKVMPNLKSFISVFFVAMYLTSGVIFPIWVIPEPYLSIAMYNPYAQILNGIRESVFAQYPSLDGVNLRYTIEVTIAMLCVGLVVYHLFKDRLLVQ